MDGEDFSRRRQWKSSELGIFLLLWILGCLPTFEPLWLIQQDTLISIRVEKSYAGFFSSDDLLFTSEVLPGDSVRLTAFIAGEEGPVDISTLNPMWFVCPNFSCFAEFPPCDDIQLPAKEPCFLGRGAQVELHISINILFDLTRNKAQEILEKPRIPVLMVSGASHRMSTEECWEKLQTTAQKGEQILDCVLGLRYVPLGPPWQLYQEIISLLDDPRQLPFEVLEQKANRNPDVQTVSVSITGTDGTLRMVQMQKGESIPVHANDEITIEIVPPKPMETYHILKEKLNDGSFVFLQLVEAWTAEWYHTVKVEGLSSSEDGLIHRFRVPEQVDQIISYTTIRDHRNAIELTEIVDGLGGEVEFWLMFMVEKN